MAITVTVDLNDVPVEKDYDLRKGDWLRETWAIQLNTSGSYAADNLSACTITLDVVDADDVSVVTGQSITASGGSSNQILVEVNATETATWSEGVYRYELKCVWPSADDTFANGLTKVLVAGEINVREEI